MQASTAPARAIGVSQRVGAGQVNCKRNHYLKTPQLVVSPLGGHPAAMQVWMLKELAGRMSPAYVRAQTHPLALVEGPCNFVQPCNKALVVAIECFPGRCRSPS